MVIYGKYRWYVAGHDIYVICIPLDISIDDIYSIYIYTRGKYIVKGMQYHLYQYIDMIIPP